ncbi:class IV lanthionine synthetase LanL [Actinomadura yumaensis]|uniref:non-specific serine/threonine protein kinase n=1 Tax=Actinomadura yumaensis TaxID=111807 RepID=A0ABW2CJF3_9ACTN
MADFNFSVFATPTERDADDGRLADVLRGALGDSEAWRWSGGGMWCSVAPVGSSRRAQGWKLHVSATPGSAAEVLARSLPVLLSGRSAFKFAASLAHVELLNARNTSRGHSGKFITVYPDSDEEAVRLARELHDATAGLPGPRILSDRPYLPRSLVHYRYGAFVEERRLTNDGFYVWVIVDPDGNLVEDRRSGAYSAPPWAVCPFPEYTPERPGRTEGGAVVIGGRFQVAEAIRHLNKGSVYRAVDLETGDVAVVKEARPHVAADLAGRDARDRLRAEARALEALAHLGVAPRPIRLFEQGGHLFLAEESIPGTTLHAWVDDLIVTDGWGGHLPRAYEMAHRLASLVVRAHDAGLLLRDFNPHNVMVRPDGRPVLIDLEFAVRAGDPAEDPPARVGTPGYAAPEQFAGCVPSAAADHYGLGASLCYLFTGGPPFLLEEEPAARPASDRLAEWLAARTDGLDIPPGLTELLLGLMAEEPGDRWSASRARDALAELPAPRLGRAVRKRPDGPDRVRERCEAAVEGITGYLVASMEPGSPERLWPLSCAHGAPDPCCVQHGAAGPLAVLARCYELTGDPRVPDAVATAGRWIARRLDAGVSRPAGLYFGTAGTAWSLLEAGRAITDDALVEKALAVARALPASVPNPDVTHGTSGLGITALHLWARTGDPAFAERAVASAEALVASADERAGDIGWATPAEYESKLAGKRYYGFAHGIAGVGYFLLACARATGRADFLALAGRVGETLLSRAVTDGDIARWGAGTGDPLTAPYWCHGASGIAAFLVRLHETTGDERFAELADRSARAVAGAAWRPSLGQCHGLAGNGDLLLDLVEATGDERHEAAAWRLARVIVANRAERDGHLVFPNEPGVPSASWGDGMSGVLAFLLRLLHGSPRLWMADDIPLVRTGASGQAQSEAGGDGDGAPPADLAAAVPGPATAPHPPNGPDPVPANGPAPAHDPAPARGPAAAHGPAAGPVPAPARDAAAGPGPASGARRR